MLGRHYNTNEPSKDDAAHLLADLLNRARALESLHELGAELKDEDPVLLNIGPIVLSGLHSFLQDCEEARERGRRDGLFAERSDGVLDPESIEPELVAPQLAVDIR
jgi:hypothetical protein